MCFHSKQSKSAQELKHRFKASFPQEELFKPSSFNAFLYPKTPVIIDQNPESIELYHWGLMPSWAKDLSARAYTLNARIETINEKPSFKYYVKKRCLILADGFYEWQWLDPEGKKKQKYLITLRNQEAFAFAGLYNAWVDKTTGEIFNTYTILTQEAKGIMREIHNHKLRMPVILPQKQEMEWLKGENLALDEVELVGEEITS